MRREALRPGDLVRFHRPPQDYLHSHPNISDDNILRRARTDEVFLLLEEIVVTGDIRLGERPERWWMHLLSRTDLSVWWAMSHQPVERII